MSSHSSNSTRAASPTKKGLKKEDSLEMNDMEKQLSGEEPAPDAKETKLK